MATFILVHGAWHNALHWAAVARHLTARGHRAVAIDMPGHGLGARFPASYLRADWDAFPTERSPVGDVTLAACAQAIADLARTLAPSGKSILVGHSNFGSAISLAGEIAPEHVERLVYVTAICPTALRTGAACWLLPEALTAKYGPIFIGDPSAIGALRINPRSPDPVYVSAFHECFYGGAPWETFAACLHALTPDHPILVPMGHVAWSHGRWGTLPRSFVRCLRDQALPLALQDRMIRDADEATPDNRFSVHDLDADHSPFASCPAELAGLLGRLGGAARS